MRYLTAAIFFFSSVGGSFAADLPEIAPDQLGASVQAPAMFPGTPIFVGFSEAGYFRAKDGRPASLSTATGWQTTVGVNAYLSRQIHVGAGFSYTNSKTDMFSSGGKSRSESYTGYARATLYFADHFNAGILGGYGWSEVNETFLWIGQTVNRSTKPKTGFLGFNVGSFFEADKWYIAPTARVLFSYTSTPAVIDSAGITLQRTSDQLTRSYFGGEIGYRYSRGDLSLTPFVRAFYTYDIRLPSGTEDRSAAELSAGLNTTVKNLTAGIEGYMRVGQRWSEIHGVRGSLSYRF
jgi:outer membrane autotransporter protein